MNFLDALLEPPELLPAPKLGRRPMLINRKTHGQSFPMSKYIGRPQKWGNPYHLPPRFHLLAHEEQLERRRKVVEKFALWLPHSGLDPRELRGLDLNCFCHDWKGYGPCPFFCHGDVLLIAANAPEGWWDAFAR